MLRDLAWMFHRINLDTVLGKTSRASEIIVPCDDMLAPFEGGSVQPFRFMLSLRFESLQGHKSKQTHRHQTLASWRPLLVCAHVMSNSNKSIDRS